MARIVLTSATGSLVQNITPIRLFPSVSIEADNSKSVLSERTLRTRIKSPLLRAAQHEHRYFSRLEYAKHMGKFPLVLSIGIIAIEQNHPSFVYTEFVLKNGATGIPIHVSHYIHACPNKRECSQCAPCHARQVGQSFQGCPLRERPFWAYRSSPQLSQNR
jgi:hypothetical protein